MRFRRSTGAPRVLPAARSASRWRTLLHPARLVTFGFAALVALGTVLLMLPVASESGRPTGVLDALFTATSAVCVTGLIVVDTPTHWSVFGEVVIAVLIQIGGFGTMALATLLALLVARRLSMRLRLTAQAEIKKVDSADLRRVLLTVAAVTLAVEAVTAAVLAARFATGYGEPLPRALYLGVFHSVSAFNNAGFALYSDNLIGFATDAWICLPIAAAVIVGGIGFPVLREVGRELRRPRRWSAHTTVTLTGTLVLLVASTVAITAIEWSNAGTLGPLGVADKLLVGFFQAVMPRTAGFNSVDYAAMEPASLLVTDILMFVGGGSAGTAGGVKVGTVALLVFVLVAEVRGLPSVHAAGRRFSGEVQRQALTVVALGLTAVAVSTLVLLAITPFSLEVVLFEVISAFGTVGLSTGITADLPAAGQLILVGLMFLGRLGPLTLGAALALRQRGRRYDLPESRPMIG